MKHQLLPSAGPAREALRAKGQFWTPDWVADAMVSYVLGGGAGTIFDPAVGAGVFFRAAKRAAERLEKPIKLLGREIDADALAQARDTGLSEEDLSGVELRNFLLDPPDGPFEGIVANPPYLRHHRISTEDKTVLRGIGEKLIGKSLDGRAGAHVYFFLRALDLLAPDGRLAFIMSADICEGVYAPALWNWVSRHYRLEAVLTFSPEASPFPGVDTNAIVYFISRETPRQLFHWARCTQANAPGFQEWVLSGFLTRAPKAIQLHERSLDEGIRTGLSRPPTHVRADCPTLGQFASVVRGIATGANEFFFLNSEQMRESGVPAEFFVRAVGRTGDISRPEFRTSDLDALDASGRPTWLLSLDGRPVTQFSPAVQRYLRHGESMKLYERPLIAARSAWYRMEKREPPAFLFAYLGRRNSRFVRNYAGIVPLTGFLCVYPKSTERGFVEALWRTLQDKEVVENLTLVGKSYGDGCVKVEPRALERLPIPTSVAEKCSLITPELRLELEFHQSAEMAGGRSVAEAHRSYGLQKESKTSMPNKSGHKLAVKRPRRTFHR